MISNLTIKDLVLVQKASLYLSTGFTVLTGETGSGKSALLLAFRLIMGQKWDRSYIRKGCEKASITATFDVDISKMLDDHGIPSDDVLIVHRDLYLNGKSKNYVNQTPVTLSFLQKLSSELMEISDQGASKLLACESNHQHLFDQYHQLSTEELSLSFYKVKELEEKLSYSLSRNFIKEREELKQKIQEIESINYQNDEEHYLFQQYTKQSSVKEIQQYCQKFTEGLPRLFNYEPLLLALIKYDEGLAPLLKSFTSACLEIEEIRNDLINYSTKLELSPDELHRLEERLKLLESYQKSYGPILPYLEQLRTQEAKLIEDEETFQELQIVLEQQKERQENLFSWFTEQRKAGISQFEQEVIEELRSLNLDHVQFKVELTPKNRGPTGDESISFWMAPNLGEKFVRVKDHISGGEMSRLLLTLKTLLAKKEKKSLIVFDEIDANIGGTTANKIGEKFLKISQSKQVIVVTHFPQVAKLAHHHFQLSKTVEGQRTFTHIEQLDPLKVQHELHRMQGLMK